MIAYRVNVNDDVLPSLVGHEGDRYASVPQPREQALALVRLLLEVPELANNEGPWRRARPGGRRTVWLDEIPWP